MSIAFVVPMGVTKKDGKPYLSYSWMSLVQTVKDIEKDGVVARGEDERGQVLVEPNFLTKGSISESARAAVLAQIQLVDPTVTEIDTF